jgi:hypothetical protein
MMRWVGIFKKNRLIDGTEGQKDDRYATSMPIAQALLLLNVARATKNYTADWN